MPNPSTTASEARVATARPARYLEQMCKHFAHRLSVARAEGSASIAFASGTCRLAAEPDALLLQVSAGSQADLQNLEDVVARHLKRFAFREDMRIEWRAA